MKDKKGSRITPKSIIGPVLFLGLAALTFYTIFHSADAKSILPALQKMNLWDVLLAVTAALFFVAAEGWMIWYLLRAVDGHVKLWQCIRYSFVGFFFSGITPSATGGQPVQLYYMNRDKINTSDATVVLMSVATAYKAVLVLIGAGLLVFWHQGLAAVLGGYMALFGLGLFLNILLVLVLLLVMRGKGIERFSYGAESLLIRFHILREAPKRREKLQEMMQRYQQTVSFFAAHKGKLFVLMLCTFVQRCSLFLLTWLIYRGMDLSQESILKVMALQAAVTIAVDMLPLPGAQGISEMMYLAVFAGVFPAGLLMPSLCATRGISFYLPLMIGGLAAAVSYAKESILRKKLLRGKGCVKGSITGHGVSSSREGNADDRFCQISCNFVRN